VQQGEAVTSTVARKLRTYRALIGGEKGKIESPGATTSEVHIMLQGGQKPEATLESRCSGNSMVDEHPTFDSRKSLSSFVDSV
jgi:hypothetical protein